VRDWYVFAEFRHEIANFRALSSQWNPSKPRFLSILNPTKSHWEREQANSSASSPSFACHFVCLQPNLLSVFGSKPTVYPKPCRQAVYPRQLRQYPIAAGSFASIKA
jgi:hypothetical protein